MIFYEILIALLINNCVQCIEIKLPVSFNGRPTDRYGMVRPPVIDPDQLMRLPAGVVTCGSVLSNIVELDYYLIIYY